MQTPHVDSESGFETPSTEPQSFVADRDLDDTTGSEGGGQSTGRQSTVFIDQRPQTSTGVQMAWIQGLLYIVVGAWPLFDLNSFATLSGPGQPVWAMQAIGIFIAGIGAYLFNGALRNQMDAEACTLGMGTALALGIIDSAYLVSGHISPFYVLDFSVQALLFGAWWYSRRTPDRTLARRRVHSTLH